MPSDAAGAPRRDAAVARTALPAPPLGHKSAPPAQVMIRTCKIHKTWSEGVSSDAERCGGGAVP